eukprot:gene7785-biopygen32401
MNSALEQYRAWATGEGIAPEPDKTQLLLSGSQAQLREPAVDVVMDGIVVEPSDSIKILGVLLDGDLTWEPQAAEAARRTHNAIHAVLRAARHLPVVDRGQLMAAMALPYVDYCQVAMVLPSSTATRTFRGAYNRAARVAARQQRWRPGLKDERWRTEPALARLRRWTTWERRRAAERAAAVCKIWHSDYPQALRKWLPDSPSAARTERVPWVRPLVCPRTEMGLHMFAAWAPEVATKVLNGSVLDGLPDVPREAPPTSPRRVIHRAPSDEWARQRHAFHSTVVERFWSFPGFTLPAGDAAVWKTHSEPARFRAAPVTDVPGGRISPERFRATPSVAPTEAPPATSPTASVAPSSAVAPTEAPPATSPTAPVAPSSAAPGSEAWVVAECMRCASFRAIIPTHIAHGAQRVIVWGDGSFTPEPGIAGYGIFYGIADKYNCALRCPGEQTSDRAEIYAFLHCIEWETRPLLYVTDSRYVHDGVTTHRHQWRSRAWFHHPLFAQYRKHADVWQKVDAILNRRGAEVLTCWGRSHARYEQACAGETSELLCFGDLCVDALAKLGSRLPHGTTRYVPVPNPSIG